jgi:AcrR family transcriptional regulator
MDASPETALDAGAPAPTPERGPRDEILTAAAETFTEKGFAAASIDDVARAMGATKGRVYHYHRSKLDLFAEVVRRGLEIIHADVTRAAEAAGPDPVARVAAMIRAHLVSILRDRPFHRCALQGVEMHLTAATTPAQREALGDLIALRDRHQRLFEDAIAAGARAGAFAPAEPRLAARTLLAALNGPVHWYRPRAGETEADRARLVEEIAAFALAGLGAEDEPTQGRKA